MSVRLYFDLIDDLELIRDDEGVEAENIEKARAEANAVIAEMRADDELIALDREWQILIRDESGAIRESIALL